MVAVECLVFVFQTCESVSSHVLCGLHIVMFCENEVGSDLLWSVWCLFFRLVSQCLVMCYVAYIL